MLFGAFTLLLLGCSSPRQVNSKALTRHIFDYVWGILAFKVTLAFQLACVIHGCGCTLHLTLSLAFLFLSSSSHRPSFRTRLQYRFIAFTSSTSPLVHFAVFTVNPLQFPFVFPHTLPRSLSISRCSSRKSSASWLSPLSPLTLWLFLLPKPNGLLSTSATSTIPRRPLPSELSFSLSHKDLLFPASDAPSSPIRSA